MKKIKIYLLLFVVIASIGIGGNEHGNGGDVVVCQSKNSEIESVRLLDYYEAEVMRPELVEDLGPPELSVWEKIEFALNKLKRVDPARAKRYRKKAKEFFSKEYTRWVENKVLEQINDSGYLPPLDLGCEIVQIAIRRKTIFPQDRLYTVRKDLWEAMNSNDDRAGLVLHEVIYGETQGLGQTDSIRARYFTTLVSSSYIDTLSLEEYYDLAGKVFGFPSSGVFKSKAFSYVVNQKEAFEIDLISLLVDPQYGPYRWAESGLPDWLRLVSEIDKIYGTPQSIDTGLHVFELYVVQDDGLAAMTKISVNVVEGGLVVPGHLDLGVARQNVPFSFDLTQHVQNPNGYLLEFSKLSGPAWLQVNENGLLSGIPTQSHLGFNQFEFRISTPLGATTISASLIVEEMVDPPHWKANPIILPDASEDAYYSAELSSFISNPQHYPVKLLLLSGPSWLSIEGTSIKGIPKRTDVGLNVARIRLSAWINGEHYTNESELQIFVHKVNHPPEWTHNPITIPDIFSDNLFELALGNFVEDIDGDELSFSKVMGPDWMLVDTEGNLKGHPSNHDVGDYTAVIRVTDGMTSEDVGLVGHVLPSQSPPMWTSDPIILVVCATQTLSESLNSPEWVIDPQGDILIFEAIENPPWVSLDINGSLIAQPGTSHIGTARFFVVATDNYGLSATVSLNIKVQTCDPLKTDTFSLGEVSSETSIEHLWVVDYSWPSRLQMHALKSHLGEYRKRLVQKKVNHTDVMISSEFRNFGSNPIIGSNALVNFDSAMDDYESEFKLRLQKSWSNAAYSSPIWAISNFVERLTGSQNSHSETPLEIVIFTQQKDIHSWYSKLTPKGEWAPEQYAAYIAGLFQNVKKPFQVSAVVCPTNEDEMPPPSVVVPKEMMIEEGENLMETYHDFLGGLKGILYGNENCAEALNTILKKLADRTAYRAHLFRQNQFSLSQLPEETEKIEVELAGKILKGNSGHESDQWYYRQKSGVVEIHWHLIDVSELKPGDTLEVTYPIS